MVAILVINGELKVTDDFSKPSYDNDFQSCFIKVRFELWTQRQVVSPNLTTAAEKITLKIILEISDIMES